jgi:hypothetical protein
LTGTARRPARRPALGATGAPGTRALSRPARRRPARLGRTAVRASNRSEQGFDLASDRRIARTLERSLLDDHNVHVAPIDLHKFERETG